MQKLQKLEDRISRLESQSVQDQDHGDFIFVDDEPASPTLTPPPGSRVRQKDPFPSIQILGWLTPARQIMLSFHGG